MGATELPHMLRESVPQTIIQPKFYSPRTISQMEASVVSRNITELRKPVILLLMGLPQED
jgi:hypothetical protein